jgi:tetratricopeptide (TPR) repeat protein
MKIFIADDLAGLSGGLREVVQRWLENDDDDTADVASEQPPVRISFSSLSRQRISDSKTRLDVAHPELMAQPEFSSRILDAIGAELLHLGYVKQAQRFIDAALNGRIKLYGDDHPVTAESFNTHARLKRLLGDLADAEKSARRALSINSRIYGEDSYAAANNLAELSAIQVQAGEFAAAEKSAQRAVHILESLYLDHSDPNATRLLDVIAWVSQARGDYDEAAELYQRLLQLDVKYGGDATLKYATHLANYATVLVYRQNPSQAEQLFKRAIDIYAVEGRVPHHPDLIDIRAMYASFLLEQGREDEAIRQLEEVIESDKQARGEDHPTLGNDYAIRGRAWYEAGNLENAKGDFGTALNVYARSVEQCQLSNDNVFIAESQGWKARTIVELAANADPAGRKQAGQEAEQLAEPALKAFQAEYEDDGVEVAIVGAILGRALALQEKDPTRARSLLSAALPIVEDKRGVDSKIATLIRAWLDEEGRERGKTGS